MGLIFCQDEDEDEIKEGYETKAENDNEDRDDIKNDDQDLKKIPYMADTEFLDLCG